MKPNKMAILITRCRISHFFPHFPLEATFLNFNLVGGRVGFCVWIHLCRFLVVVHFCCNLSINVIGFIEWQFVRRVRLERVTARDHCGSLLLWLHHHQLQRWPTGGLDGHQTIALHRYACLESAHSGHTGQRFSSSLFGDCGSCCHRYRTG